MQNWNRVRFHSSIVINWDKIAVQINELYFDQKTKNYLSELFNGVFMSMT